MSANEIVAIDALVFTVDSEYTFAIDSKHVIELVHKNMQEIYNVPKTVYPFLGVTLYNDRAIPIIELRGWLLKMDREKLDNRIGVIVVDYSGLTIGFAIRDVIGYESISEQTDLLNLPQVHTKFLAQKIYRTKSSEQPILYFDVKQALSKYIGEFATNVVTTDDELDIDQFTIPEGEDDIDINQFTLPDE